MSSGLTGPQKAALKSSWSRFMDNAVTNGTNFYMDLFKAYPDTLTPFKSLFEDVSFNQMTDHPTMKAQALVFCNGMSSFVDNLDDHEVLVVLLQKMAKLHFNRGIRIKELRDGYGVLLRYLEDHCHVEGSTKNAWEDFIAYICRVQGDFMKERL
uniref:Hemoglobin III n=1 Tax=Phacoides pectinatus TaxID=244486 RepID=A7UAU9_PHAPT|nr:hemoglobin III [Phacoides pectinatus]ACH68470.1 hemoglobin III [Phacoides pectinatus]